MMTGRDDDTGPGLSMGAESPTVQTVEVLLEEAASLLSGEDPSRLLALGFRAHTLSRLLPYERGEAYALIFMGFARWFLGDYETAQRNLLDSHPLLERLGDEAGTAKSLVGLLCVEKSLGIYDRSLAKNLKSLTFFRETGDRFWEGLCLMGLATLHSDVGDVERSIDYYQQVLSVGRELGKDWMVARALVGLGSAAQARGDSSGALRFLRESLPLFEAVGNRMGEARALNDVGSAYQDLGDLDSALDFYRRALTIRREIRQREAQATTLIRLGQLFVRRRNAESALESLREALEIAEEIRSQPKIYKAHEALAEAYELARDLEKALRHHRLYQQAKEAVFSQEANARLKNLQTRFEVDKAEAEAEITRLKNVELREKNEQLQELLEELRATQAQLVHSAKMASLGKLVAGLTHELASPAGSIHASNGVRARCLGALQSIFEQARAHPEVLEGGEFKKVMGLLEEDLRVSASATARIAGIVKSLRSFARLDQPEFQKTDVRRGIESAIDLLPTELRERVKIVKQYDDVPKIRCYPAELNQVFLTLLTNAAEAIEGTGKIRVRVAKEGKNIRIDVADDGRGIPPERLERLFDFDFSAGHSRVKMGTGLISGRNIVAHHDGRIDVESEVGKGTTFSILLPVNGPSADSARILASPGQ